MHPAHFTCAPDVCAAPTGVEGGSLSGGFEHERNAQEGRCASPGDFFGPGLFVDVLWNASRKTNGNKNPETFAELCGRCVFVCYLCFFSTTCVDTFVYCILYTY